MREASVNLTDEARDSTAGHRAGAIRLCLKALLLAGVCYFSTEIGFAHKLPPHNISPLWPTSAILFSVLVVAPVRHWWVYIVAAYFSSVLNDARAGFPLAAVLFVVAGLGEIIIAAVGVRRFCGGLRAFDSLRSLAAYLVVAVFLAPIASAFVAAFAGSGDNYWFYWRVWFLSEALAYLVLAPAILTWIGSARSAMDNISPARFAEATLIGGALLAVSLWLFSWSDSVFTIHPAMVYLPLPFLILAAVRFGPVGINTCLLMVASLSISGAVAGNGPFAAGTVGDSVLALQLFLVVVAVPLMLLAALIRERQDKEGALRESEENATLAASSGKLGLWHWDVPQDQVWLGPGGSSLFRLGESIPVDFKRFMEILHPEDRGRVRAEFERALRIGGSHVMEYRIDTEENSVRWLVTRVQVELLPSGQPARVRGVSMDISDRKRSEQALSESEARFRTVADNAPVMIWMSGPDKLCTFFNKGWLDFTGGTMKQELGNGWMDGIHLDDSSYCVEAYESSFNAREDFTIEYRLRRFDGEYCWVLDHGVPRFDSAGGFLGYIGVAMDITERKRSEAELTRSRAELAHVARVSMMGEMTASLAHELNQPLTAILSNAQAAQRFMNADPPDLEEVQEILKDIVDDNSRAAEVIRRIRALAKKEALEFDRLDLAGTVQEVIALVHNDVVLHNVRVYFHHGADLPTVRGDKIQLQQVVLNLLLNALDAMKNSPVEERIVEISLDLEKDGMVKASVNDKGIGISSDTIDKIFQPFYTTKREGLGMGLSISSSIIEAHGGQLWAERNRETGTNFCFTVPVAKEDGAQMTQSETNRNRAKAAVKGGKDLGRVISG